MGEVWLPAQNIATQSLEVYSLCLIVVSTCYSQVCFTLSCNHVWASVTMWRPAPLTPQDCIHDTPNHE